MKSTIERIIREFAEITAFQIKETVTEKHEAYFVHEKAETIRNSSTVNYDVLIHCDHSKGKIGVSTFLITAAMSEQETRDEVYKALERCKKINNDRYEFPEQENFSSVVHSNIREFAPEELIKKIYSCFFTAQKDKSAAINALEIFITERRVHLINSRGLDKEETISNLFVEFIPTYTVGNDSVELYKSSTLNVIDFTDLKKEIDQALQDVKARYEAKKPETNLAGKVVFRPLEIQDIVSGLTRSLNYSAVYAHVDPHKIGDDLQKGCSGQRLKVTLTNKQKGLVLDYFDNMGSAYIPTTVIDDGKIVSNYGGTQFAQLLNKPCTGILPFIKVEAGPLTEEELCKAPYLECASMSGIQVSVESDYIGGEIRLGYYWDGQKRIPVSGITISGKLSEVLASAVLSKDIVAVDRYEGPDRLIADHFEIL